MVVKVKLFATFRQGRFREKDMELPDGCTVEWVLEHLKIPRRQLGIIYLNGLAVSMQEFIKENAMKPQDEDFYKKKRAEYNSQKAEAEKHRQGRMTPLSVTIRSSGWSVASIGTSSTSCAEKA